MEITIISILVYILIVCIAKLLKYNADENLRKSVAWCASCNDKLRANISLIGYIHGMQLDHNIPNLYRLTLHTSCTDKQFVNDILAEYQHDLTESFFAGNLIPVKSKYHLVGEPYFWISLQRYLTDRADSLSRLCGQDLYYYENKDAVLTEYGIIFYKLLYITFLANKELGITPPYSWAIDNAKRYIETGIIK